MASPHHRHRSSLEGVINFSNKSPLGIDERSQAKRRFYHIVNHFEATDDGSSGSSGTSTRYNRPLLIRLTYEYARSDVSQDGFLQAFFQTMALSMDQDVDLSDEKLEEEVRSTLVGFADYLMDNFFLPLKASTKKTPQPSPAYHSAIERIQGTTQAQQVFVGTPDRLSALRGACLVRDRHRCVISRRFDRREAEARLTRSGYDDAQDDDGNQLSSGAELFGRLEVAHILPHSLTKVDSDAQLTPSKQAALSILNMFDNDAVHLIEGTDIDRPRNAMTLLNDLHDLFGDFKVYFEPVGEQPHTYRIDSFLPPVLVQGLLPNLASFPVTRTLFLTPTRTIDPPSPRLLAIHCAIAHILHLSAAGVYIDQVLRDMESQGVRADGSTELGRFVKLGLGGWLDGVDAC